MAQAFHRLCGYCRNTNTGLARASGDLIDGHLDPNSIFGLASARQTQPRTLVTHRRPHPR
jgi:hypothetical protein